MSDAPDVDDRVDYEDGSNSEMEEEVEEEHVEEYEEEEEVVVDDDGGDREEGQEELAEDEDNNINIDIETTEDEEEREEDVGEEDLRDLCELFGEIFEVRLMKDIDSGESKGYAFVGFKTKNVAQKAIVELHSKETLRCSFSETKNRLFIGNIPKDWTEDEFRKIIEGVGPEVENIELIKVKSLYVKNIPENTSTEELKELFQRYGEVTKVVTPPRKGGKRDFGFVHYAERSSALKAVKDSEIYEINGQLLEVVLAKPQAERKHEPSSYAYGATPTPTPFSLPTFGGFAAPPYGAMGIVGSFTQPMIYGR
ncbi:unnamed protein product [Eruca vesicaria subsp. sativa]|uniref:RRM domain-containing protein n=1 Tax=Eruca vesicaria subsp. sativa TaxID=29727 RepID=A0ABC8M9H1_ERUVS|nr:unnamed protein product [Eruca vesicaria subsp. sativa]